jgi:DNA-binding transcriptional regulator YhcF (GntR family)
MGRVRRNGLWRGLALEGVVSDSMLVDPSSDRALYKQLADVIRAQISSGEFAPGQRLPAQKDYMQEHQVSRDTVERAMVLLRNEGLIVAERRGNGSRVRPVSTRMGVPLVRGEVFARMPTDPERKIYGIGEGVPLLVVKRDDHDEEIYPADQVEIEIRAGVESCDGDPSSPNS